MPNHSALSTHAARVLVVDDEAAIRSSLAGILADEGYEAALAEDGDKALASVRERAPDVVLLDVTMPGRDGLAVLEDLRRTQPALPVVMMSGHGTIETAVQATKLGAFDFIEKPLSLDKLLLVVRHALETSALERENRELRAKTLRADEIVGYFGRDAAPAREGRRWRRRRPVGR